MPKKQKVTPETLGAMGDNDFLSAREAADCLGVYYGTFLTMLRKGVFPFWQFANTKNSAKKVKVGDIKAFLESKKRIAEPVHAQITKPQSADNGAEAAQIAASNSDTAAPTHANLGDIEFSTASATAFFKTPEPAESGDLKDFAAAVTDKDFKQAWGEDWRKKIESAIDATKSGQSEELKIRTALELSYKQFKALNRFNAFFRNQIRFLKQGKSKRIKAAKSDARAAAIINTANTVSNDIKAIIAEANANFEKAIAHAKNSDTAAPTHAQIAEPQSADNGAETD